LEGTWDDESEEVFFIFSYLLAFILNDSFFFLSLMGGLIKIVCAAFQVGFQKGLLRDSIISW